MIVLDHTIVYADDAPEAAEFLAGLLGLPDPQPTPDGRYLAVALPGGPTLRYTHTRWGLPVLSQHYAFAVSDREFDEIYGRLRDRSLPHWADARHAVPATVGATPHGRRVFLLDPAGHDLEILTRVEPEQCV